MQRTATLSESCPNDDAGIKVVRVATNWGLRYYCLSILDKHHQPTCDFERGMALLKMCSDELKRRLPIDFKGLLVKVVDKNGIREVEFDDSKPIKSA